MAKVKKQLVSADNRFHVGVDENGLGAQLGPMLVTAVMAELSPKGESALKRKLPQTLAKDLDDSKALVKFGKHALAEAWARALYPEAATPAALLKTLSLRSPRQLQSRCPDKATQSQCWGRPRERFEAPAEMVSRVRKHVEQLSRRGITLVSAKSEILCTSQLNAEREAGANRFISDLHAMERLVLSLRTEVDEELVATCGKVGGIGKYERYFGPLSGRLRTVLQEQRRHAAYHFPGLGELHFVQDADASNPLVMVASLIGKYLRELTMGRISWYYSSNIEGVRDASGYHDPVSSKLVQLSRPHRHKFGIPEACFQRFSDA